MYLRRKTFSQDDYDILDIVAERAFCEGYEYAQREFSDDSDNEKKAAIAAGALGAAGLGGGYLTTRSGVKNVKNALANFISLKSGKDYGSEEYKELDKFLEKKNLKTTLEGLKGKAKAVTLGIPNLTGGAIVQNLIESIDAEKLAEKIEKNTSNHNLALSYLTNSKTRKGANLAEQLMETKLADNFMGEEAKKEMLKGLRKAKWGRRAALAGLGSAGIAAGLGIHSKLKKKDK